MGFASQREGGARAGGATPFHDLGPAGEFPRAALVGEGGAEEFNSRFVLSRLADLLGKAAVEGHAEYRLLRRVILVPGGLHGPLPPALAEAVQAARYRIQVHSAEAGFEALPRVEVQAPNDEERANAFLFGLPAVTETGPAEATGTPPWYGTGGENFILEAGQAGGLQLKHCERLFQALINFLRHGGVLSGGSTMDADEDVHFFQQSQCLTVPAARAGLFASHLAVGRWVQRGETLGYIYDAFDGHVLAETTSPASGLVSAIRRHPLAGEGEALARIQIP